MDKVKHLVNYGTLCISLATMAWCSGCAGFRDVDDLFPPTDTVTTDDTNGTSETDTPSGSSDEGTDPGTEPATDTASQPGTDGDSVTSSGTGTEGTGTGTESGDTESGSITDTGSDSETTCEDVCANECCGQQCCGHAEDVCFEEACCTPKSCEELGAVCGQADDGCGGTLHCGTCSDETEYCAEDGQCADDCEDRVCGASPNKGFDCGTCPKETEYCTMAGLCVDDCEGRVCGKSPVQGFQCGTCPADWHCTDAGQCVECTEKNPDCGAFICDFETNTCATDCGGDDGLCATGYHCDAGACVADLANGGTCDEASDCASANCQNDVCCEAGEVCCADQSDCDAPEASICLPTKSSCVSCSDEDLCSAQYKSTAPFCDPTTGRCEQCVEDADCRDENHAVNPSPVGVCTPERTCTCWAENETWECDTASDCPAGTVCAKEKGTSHYVCLKQCEPEQAPFLGLTCEEKTTVDEISTSVWAPVTTCFAFTKLGETCSDNDDCKVSNSDGKCETINGEDVCTYACWDGSSANDNWCPSSECRENWNICEP